MEVVPPGYKANANSPFAPLPDGFGPQAEKPERPLRLPKVAPMPLKRPDRQS